MTRTLLVAMDNSEPARVALEHACEVHPDASITVVHVVDPADGGTYTSMTGGQSDELNAKGEHNEARAEEIFAETRAIVAKYGREIETDILSGSVASTVVSYARENDIDHIVVGSHGRTGASRVLLGSVAEQIARQSPLPVTIVN